MMDEVSLNGTKRARTRSLGVRFLFHGRFMMERAEKGYGKEKEHEAVGSADAGI